MTALKIFGLYISNIIYNGSKSYQSHVTRGVPKVQSWGLFYKNGYLQTYAYLAVSSLQSTRETRPISLPVWVRYGALCEFIFWRKIWLLSFCIVLNIMSYFTATYRNFTSACFYLMVCKLLRRTTHDTHRQFTRTEQNKMSLCYFPLELWILCEFGGFLGNQFLEITAWKQSWIIALQCSHNEHDGVSNN